MRDIQKENKRKQKEKERQNPFGNPIIDRRPENKPDSDSEIGNPECFPPIQKTPKIKSAMKNTIDSNEMQTSKQEPKSVVFEQKPQPV